MLALDLPSPVDQEATSWLTPSHGLILKAGMSNRSVIASQAIWFKEMHESYHWHLFFSFGLTITIYYCQYCYFHCCYTTMLPMNSPLFHKYTASFHLIPSIYPGCGSEIVPMQRKQTIILSLISSQSTLSPKTVQIGGTLQGNGIADTRNQTSDISLFTVQNNYLRIGLKANSTKWHKLQLILINARSSTNKQPQKHSHKVRSESKGHLGQSTAQKQSVLFPKQPREISMSSFL